jgi:electron transfer flavoprotein alpha/beta subunit
MALTDRSNRKIANEHPKFVSMADEFKKHKDEIVEKVKMADISQKDIDATRLKGFAKQDLDTLKMTGTVNDSLTQEELTKLKQALKDGKTSTLETTGKFKKD